MDEREKWMKRKKAPILSPYSKPLSLFPSSSLFKFPFFFLSPLFLIPTASSSSHLSPPLLFPISLLPHQPSSSFLPFLPSQPLFMRLPLSLFVFVYPAILRAAPGSDIWRSPLCYCHPLTQLSVGITDT